MDLQDFLNIPEKELFAECSRLRRNKAQNKVELCAIINIRNGACGMDCKFCAQSAHYNTGQKTYGLLPVRELLRRIEYLEKYPLRHIGLVASGSKLPGEEFEELLNFLQSLSSERKKRLCLSLGRLDGIKLSRLKKAGITHYHHNLETSQSFYPKICSTQKWEARKTVVKNALELGFELCSGGIFGIGETWQDRLDLANSLDELGVRNIPINFLIPQKGTPLSAKQVLNAEEALRIIAFFRLRFPNATLRICGGRKQSLGERQYESIAAGADALMSGNYLTSPGEELEKDLNALADLDFAPA